MERIKVSEHYFLDELFNKEMTEKYGVKALEFLHPNLLKANDLLRELMGAPCYINNWYKGGIFDDCGYRDVNCKEGAKMSAHKPVYFIEVAGKRKFVCMATDNHSPKKSGQDFYNVFVRNAKRFYDLGIRRVESPKVTTGWFHMDFKEHGVKNTIQVIYGTHNIIL